MFEKEAEEYADKKARELNINKCNLAYHATRIAYQKGAEFGYNKAKEEIETLKKNNVEITDQWCKEQQKVYDLEQEIFNLKELHKANEWHYVENGDLPKKSILVLGYFEDMSLAECLYIPDEGFKHPIFSEWFKPVAWIEKEKVLPRESE